MISDGFQSPGDHVNFGKTHIHTHNEEGDAYVADDEQPDEDGIMDEARRKGESEERWRWGSEGKSHRHFLKDKSRRFPLGLVGAARCLFCRRNRGEEKKFLHFSF